MALPPSAVWRRGFINAIGLVAISFLNAMGLVILQPRERSGARCHWRGERGGRGRRGRRECNWLGRDWRPQLHGDNRRRGQKRQERVSPLLTPDTGAGFRVGRRAVREPPLREENVIVYGIHPHPNLPPSRGKGLLGAGEYRIWRRATRAVREPPVQGDRWG